jgi:hypothetical protein
LDGIASFLYPKNGVLKIKIGWALNCNDVLVIILYLITYHHLLYPNPAKECLNIELPKAETAHGTIYSLSGEKIKEFEVQNRVSVQSLNSGIYVLQVTTDSSVFNTKLIKN